MNPVLPSIDARFLIASIPVLVLFIFGFVALLSSVSKRLQTKTGFYQSLSFIAVIVSMIFVLTRTAADYSLHGIYLDGGYVVNRFSGWTKFLALFVGLISLMLLGASHLKERFFRGELCSIFLMTLGGMLCVMSTYDLVTFFVTIELVSIGMYVLVGYLKPSRMSQEAAIKYFVLGGASAAILLFGIALIYAATGTLNATSFSLVTSGSGNLNSWLNLGVVMALVGLGFKLALVPFHMWSPDAYEGASTPITLFMATAVKIMVFSAIIQLFGGLIGQVKPLWIAAISLLAASSMIFANIMALSQQSIKRMMAYSSIAHTGYMSLALIVLGSKVGVSGGHAPETALLFYLLTYTLISIGAFAIVSWLENEKCENIIVDDFSGFASRFPVVAVGFSILLLALGGMPPSAGFIAKFFVFSAPISQDIFWVVVVACVSSTIALYYYMKIIVKMFMTPKNPSLEGIINPKFSMVHLVVGVLAVIYVILVGTIAPEPVYAFLKSLTIM
jgi:NADH-quinone oxidoreductase subunit N